MQVDMKHTDMGRQMKTHPELLLSSLFLVSDPVKLLQHFFSELLHLKKNIFTTYV